ncbi:hypothetical protein BGZ46_005788, partial [Entomortierella lignicola]
TKRTREDEPEELWKKRLKRGAKDFLQDYIEIDETWEDQVADVLRKQTEDEEFQSRLALAHEGVSAHNENTKKTLSNLLMFGLAVEDSALSSVDSLARNISRTLLNASNSTGKPCPYHFKLKGLDSSQLSREQLEIPVPSRLLLHYLSQKLNINIYLFSTKSKPHFFKANGTKTAIGFFHVVDSFLGSSKFLVLTKSRNSPRISHSHQLSSSSPLSSLPPSSSTPAGFQSEFSVARYREEARSRTSHNLIDGITKQDCEDAIKAA